MNASSRVLYGQDTGGRVLVLGTVTNSPKYNFGQMQGIANYIMQGGLDKHGIASVEVLTVDSVAKMIELFESGRVDWVSATPYAALTYESQTGAHLVATKKSRGRASYSSIFFTRRDSGIESIDDLVGKTIAFEKPGSTSAFFLPATEILQLGYKLGQLAAPREAPPPDTIGYVFSGDELNSSTWVHKNIVVAGAFSDADWDSEWITPDGFKEDLLVFHKTKQVPRSIEVMRSGLEVEIIQKIKQVLFDSNKDPDAGIAMRGYYRASDFSDLTAQQLDSLNEIRATMRQFDSLKLNNTKRDGTAH